MRIRTGQDVLIKGYEVWRVFYFRNMTSLYLFNNKGEVKRSSVRNIFSVIRGPEMCETEDIGDITINVPVDLNIHREILQKNKEKKNTLKKFDRVKFLYLYQGVPLEIKGLVVNSYLLTVQVVEWGCGVPCRFWEVPAFIIEEWVYFSD